MNSIKTLKNCLNKKSFDLIKNIFENEYFPWYLTGVNTKEDLDKGFFQFYHSFYRDKNIQSPFFQDLNPLFDIINPKTIIRIKANMLIKTEKIIEHGFHYDYPLECKVAIFYVNSNNGYTIFKNNEKIMSEENKIIIFNNDLMHSGSTCTDKTKRIIINFNYL
jgi:hypothetical protein